MHDIAIVHDILFALYGEPARIPARGLRSELDEIFILDNLGADKSFSKSVWITPAACGADIPLVMVQARTSFSPAVK